MNAKQSMKVVQSLWIYILYVLIMDFIIISCIFGKAFNYVHESPGVNSYFFTNNIILKNEIETNEWNYVFVNMPFSEVKKMYHKNIK